MKCKNCNGDLILKEGILECNSCGSQFSLNEFCEDIDLFICYIESDANGRRTKDSLIAQEIYYLFEEKKIKTFYKRISLEKYTGNDVQILEDFAIEKAKTVILVGTTTEYFSVLWDKYSNNFSSKKVIPVYQGIEANELPKEIKPLQALKYDRVGSASDLINGVFNSLGRQIEIEQDFEKLTTKQNKRKLFLIPIIALVAIAILAAGIFIGKRFSVNTEEESVSETNAVVAETQEESSDLVADDEVLYNKAAEYLNSNEYADAIDIFTELGDYKDSATLLNLCYTNYAGYYYDEQSGLFFQLQKYENSGSVEISFIDDDGNRCIISETIDFSGCKTEFDFNDGENNHGKGYIILDNDGMTVSIKTTEFNSTIFIPDSEVKFFLANKSDQPITNEVTSGFLEELLGDNTTIGDLKRAGYDVSYERPLYRAETESVYSLDNTDIVVVAFSYDIKKMQEYRDNGNYNSASDLMSQKVDSDDYIIFGLTAPAYLVIPDKIGNTNEPFIENDYMFYPDGEIELTDMIGCDYCYGNKKIGEITENTHVTVFSKTSVGDSYWKILIEEFVCGKALQKYNTDYDASAYSACIEIEEPNYYGVVVSNSINGDFVQYCVYKDDYRVEDTSVVYDDFEHDNNEGPHESSDWPGLTEEELEIVGDYEKSWYDDVEFYAHFSAWPEDDGKLHYDLFLSIPDNASMLEEYVGTLQMSSEWDGVYFTDDGLFMIMLCEIKPGVKGVQISPNFEESLLDIEMTEY